jgi:hypothetical protein
MNDLTQLTDAKVLKGKRILFNAFKDIYLTSKMKFENSLLKAALTTATKLHLSCEIYVFERVKQNSLTS